jgi:xanthine dehydrogenase accessory factor
VNNPAALTLGPTDSDWPLFGLIDDVRPALREILASGRAGALATLVRVDGPSPRAVGSQMAIAADGRAAGYVSGGCVEGSVATVGREVAETGVPRHLVFGAGSPFADVRLVCGSRIEVFVERARKEDETLRALLEAYDERRAVARWIWPDGRAEIRPADGAAIGVDESGAMWKRYDPPTRVIVLGQDPVALATAQMARQMGYESVLVRRLGPPSAPAHFASNYMAAAPADALSRVALDRWTAVVTTTHDLDDDHEALDYALRSQAFYVGALGSRLRVADRVMKLEQAGLEWDDIRRLRAPVGLDIGAATPMEIALSILGDIVRVQRKG